MWPFEDKNLRVKIKERKKKKGFSFMTPKRSVSYPTAT